MVEQHFGSESVAIEVEIGFMETKVKQKNERETQPKRTSPFSLIFFAKVVARQTKGKNDCRWSQHSFYELSR